MGAFRAFNPTDASDLPSKVINVLYLVGAIVGGLAYIFRPNVVDDLAKFKPDTTIVLPAPASQPPAAALLAPAAPLDIEEPDTIPAP